MYKNLQVNMTAERYYKMCEQMGKEPDPSEIPPTLEDFPEIVQNAINTFNMLGDRVYPEIGYMGKDYTNLNIFLELYEIEDKEFFLELLCWLDARAVKESQEHLKREYNKVKNKR